MFGWVVELGAQGGQFGLSGGGSGGRGGGSPVGGLAGGDLLVGSGGLSGDAGLGGQMCVDSLVGVEEPSAADGVMEPQSAPLGVKRQPEGGAVTVEASGVVDGHLHRLPSLTDAALALQRRGEEPAFGRVEPPVLLHTHLQVLVGLNLQVDVHGALRGDLEHERRRRPHLEDPVAGDVGQPCGVHAEAHVHVRRHDLAGVAEPVVDVVVLADETVLAIREVAAQRAVGPTARRRVRHRVRHRRGGRIGRVEIHIGHQVHNRASSQAAAAASPLGAHAATLTGPAAQDQLRVSSHYRL